MEMEERNKLYEQVTKIIEDSLSDYINSTLEELTSRIGDLKSRIIEDIETKENEKLNEVRKVIDEKVKSNEIAENVKTQSEHISDNKLKELESKLDEIIREKVYNKEREFEGIIEKALKSKETQEKISQEIVKWLSEHKDFLSDILEDRIKAIITEKKEKELTKNIEDFLKSGDFKDMIKLQFMNYLATSRDAFTNAAKEALREQIEREGDKVLKEAMKNVDEMVKEIVENRMKEALGEKLDNVVDEFKNTINELKGQIEELKNKLSNLSEDKPTEEAGESVEESEVGEQEEPKLELHENIEEHIEGISSDESNEMVEEEESGVEAESIAVEDVEVSEPVAKIFPEERGIRLTDILRIKYYGHSSFLFSNSKVKLIMDPYKKGALNGSIAYESIEDVADLVTVSHGHMDHAAWKEIPGNPTLVEATGDKVIKGIKFKGIYTYHDKAHGALRGSNMVFSVELSGAKIVHLGDLGHILTNDQVKEIGLVDILIVPVGGYFTIDAEDAWQVVEQLDPLVVIPVHYRTQYVDLPISDVTPFLKDVEKYGFLLEELGVSEIEIDRLPKKKTVWIFEPANVGKI